MKKEKNASKEALDAATFAEFFFGPGAHDLRNEIVEELIPIEERKSFRTGR